MAFKTKREKYAYVKGIKKGMKGGKPYGRKKKAAPKSGSGRKQTAKPIYDYSEWFDFDSRGNIKGSYVDGRFEPD